MFNHKKLYAVWQMIKQRCLNPNNNRYKYYGAKGIGICTCWKKDFKIFFKWSIENGYKDGLSIDRIDVNGDYEPNNCRWVCQKKQNRNTTRNRNITYENETLCVSEWAERYGVNRKSLTLLLNKNYSLWDAITHLIVLEGKRKLKNSLSEEKYKIISQYFA